MRFRKRYDAEGVDLAEGSIGTVTTVAVFDDEWGVLVAPEGWPHVRLRFLWDEIDEFVEVVGDGLVTLPVG